MARGLSLAVALALVGVLVSAEPRWRNFFLHEDIVMGMSFLDMKTGWAVRMRSGSGPEAGPAIMRTTDGGRSWERGSWATPPPMSILMPFDISMTAQRKGVLVGTGLLMVPGRLFTTDGVQFNNSLAMGMDNSRSVKPFGSDPDHFAAVGVFSFSEEGVAITRDAGVTWRQVQWPATNFVAPNSAEYISEDLWYVGAGTFPNDDDDDKRDDRPIPLRAGWSATGLRRSGVSAAKDGSFKIELHAPTAEPKRSTKRRNDYYSVIRKTEDGGRTWKTLFEEDGGYSYESISCPSANVCYAAGASSILGGRLLRTEDGGATWQTVVEHSTRALSTVQFFNKDEGWVTGGWPQANQGYAARTFDGGETWQEYSLITYPLYAKFLDMNNGWASGPNFPGGGMDLMQFEDRDA